MVAPQLIPLQDLLHHPRLRVPRVPFERLPDAVRPFVVLRGGSFRGQRYHEGDVLLCLGQPGIDEVVVLEPRGRGCPQVGTTNGAALYGDAHEVCSPIRWRVAGPVVAVLRPADERQLEAQGPSRLFDFGERRRELPGWGFLPRLPGAAELLFGPDATEAPAAGDGHEASDRACRRQLSLFQFAA